MSYTNSTYKKYLRIGILCNSVGLGTCSIILLLRDRIELTKVGGIALIIAIALVESIAIFYTIKAIRAARE